MKNKIIIVGVICILLVLVFIFSKSDGTKNNEEMLNINYNVKGNEVSLENYKTDNPVVAMYIEKYGSVVMELYPDKAPNTVNNFISLIKSGFYDNNTFHRLVTGFVLQGGDPNGTGAGGPGYSIKGEFSDNGFENDLKHEKGILSMARSAFGKVIDGFDIIEKIEKNERVADSDSGKLAKNLTLKKTLVDLKGKEYSEVEKIN